MLFSRIASNVQCPMSNVPTEESYFLFMYYSLFLYIYFKKLRELTSIWRPVQASASLWYFVRETQWSCEVRLTMVWDCWSCFLTSPEGIPGPGIPRQGQTYVNVVRAPLKPHVSHVPFALHVQQASFISWVEWEKGHFMCVSLISHQTELRNVMGMTNIPV